MAKFCSDITAIVVGNARQELIHQTTAYLDKAGIPCELCDDVYSAVAAMAVAPPVAPLLVVGYFTTLATENMRLFSLVPKGRQVIFCCLITKWFESDQPRLQAARNAGVFVVNSVEQIDDVIKQCTSLEAPAAKKQKTEGKDFASRIATLADSFFLTQAEQDALLGVENNADTTITFTE